MIIPSPFSSWLAALLYGFLIYIIIVGLWQFYRSRIKQSQDATQKLRSLVPLGYAAVVIGAIGYFKGRKEAFDTIEAAGDISPSIIANSMANTQEYLILGLVCLAISCVFKYTNSP